MLHTLSLQSFVGLRSSYAYFTFISYVSSPLDRLGFYTMLFTLATTTHRFVLVQTLAYSCANHYVANLNE